MKKRPTAGSPPPASSPLSLPTGPKPKKARPSKASASNQPTPAGSPPASSPPAHDGAGATPRAVSPVVGGSPKGKERDPDGEGEPAGGGEAEEEVDQEGDGADSDVEFGDDEFKLNQKENARQKENLRVLLDSFDQDQMDRYEQYRRSGLTKASVKKLVNHVLGNQSVGQNIITVVRGFGKVFVGEIVEKAREVGNHDGALTPDDLREAYRLYQLEHERTGTARRKMFTR